MAWCPFAVHKPLSENHTQGAIVPRAVILHTAVSSSKSLFDFFQNRSDLESHFYVTEEGVIEQYMDTTRRADANKNANAFAVSIETEDGGQIRPWSEPQLAALIRLVAWICDTHGIPKRLIPDAYGSGIGWHVQFGAPGPWTPVAKACPGAPRIEQTKNTLIPAVANYQEDDDLTPDQSRKLDEIVEQLTGSRKADDYPGWQSFKYPKDPKARATVTDYIRYIDENLINLAAKVDSLAAAVAKMGAAK